MTNALALTASALLGSSALRRRAVRDALAAAFVSGFQRTTLSALIVGALLGTTLLQFVLPLLPLVGSRPDTLAAIFLFAIQHLGDVIAGTLVVGQAGLAATWELWHARERHRFTSVAAAGMDPMALFVLPQVWGIAVVYFTIGMMFKVSAVMTAAYINLAIDGHFLGPEIGTIIETDAAGILGGYGLNAAVGLLAGAICCAPVLGPTPTESNPPIGSVFRRTLVLIFAAKLLFFVF